MAQTVIGNLQVRLTAITSQFTRGLGDAAKTVRSFSRFMQTDLTAAAARGAGALSGVFINALTSIPRLVVGAIQSLLKFATVIGVTLVGAVTTAAGALALLTRNSFKAIDDLRTMAIRFGVSTEAISTFAFAAGEANVELSSVASAMVKATKAIGEAAIKSGAARDALRELGLSAVELYSLRPDEQFEAIATALGKVENQTKKTRLALALFGKGGAEILPLLAEDLQEAAKWAEILGLKVTDFDAAQIDAAGDAVARLKAAFVGVGNELAARVAPLVKGLTDQVLNFIAAQGGVAAIVGRVISGVTSVAIQALNRIGQAAQGIANFTQGLGLDANTPGDAIEVATAGIAKLANGIIYVGALFRAVWLTFEAAAVSAFTGASGLLTGFIDLINQIPGIEIDTSFLVAFTEDLAKQTAEAATKAADAWRDAFGDGIYRVTQQVGEGITALGDKAAAIADGGAKFVGERFEGWADTLANLGLEDIEAMLQRIGSIVPVAPLSENQGMTAEEYFAPWLEGTSGIKDLTKSTTDEMQRIWERTSDSIADSLASAFFRGENALEALLNTALSVAEQIFSAFLKQSVLDPIFGAFGLGGGGASFGAAQTFSGASAASTFGVGAQASQGVTIVNNFYEPVGTESGIAQAVRQGIVKERNLVGDIAEQRVSKKNGRNPRYAFGS